MQLPNLAASALLRRGECAAALKLAGYPISAKTLATKATRGGGPPYHKFGRAVLYRWSEALSWAEQRLSPAIGSTSEQQKNFPGINPKKEQAENTTEAFHEAQ